MTTEKLIEKYKIIHGEKYDYSLVDYINTRKKVKIMCKKHNEIFEQSPGIHLSGVGCPKCNESKGEKKISSILEDNNIIYTSQHKFNDCKHINRLPFDFYIEDYKTCIEYDGRQHTVSVDRFGGEKALKLTKFRDDIKNKYCEQNGINLIRISYTDNIDEKMSDFLNIIQNK